MEPLTEKDVRHIANLAHIELTSQEVEQFQEQLTSVIGYNMALLSEVDVSNVEPTAQTTGLVNVWQEDVVQPSLDPEVALSQAPQKKDQQFVVKQVLGES